MAWDEPDLLPPLSRSNGMKSTKSRTHNARWIGGQAQSMNFHQSSPFGGMASDSGLDGQNYFRRGSWQRAEFLNLVRRSGRLGSPMAA